MWPQQCLVQGTRVAIVTDDHALPVPNQTLWRGPCCWPCARSPGSPAPISTGLGQELAVGLVPNEHDPQVANLKSGLPPAHVDGRVADRTDPHVAGLEHVLDHALAIGLYL